jgi:hypothetical protein
VTLDVDFTSQPGTAVIAFDGVASAPLKLDGTTMTGADIALGATYTESVNTDFSALFDNVVAD